MRYFGKDIKIFINNLVVSYTDEGSDDAMRHLGHNTTLETSIQL
jgi:hypothetical protein